MTFTIQGESQLCVYGFETSRRELLQTLKCETLKLPEGEPLAEVTWQEVRENQNDIEDVAPEYYKRNFKKCRVQTQAESMFTEKRVFV